VPSITTVAVGTDGSASAGEAVRAAIELAERFEAKLVLISAFKRSARPERSEQLEWVDNPAARVRDMLERTEHDVRARGTECTTLVAEGDPAEVLVRLAAECGADVLVVGNKGMHRRYLASVPNTVTHTAPCSVFVVKTVD